MSRLLLQCVIAASLVLAACGAQSPHTVRVREQDAGRTVALRRGDRLAVVLEGNPTTGYAWEQIAGDAAVIEPAGEPAITPNSGALGASGVVTMPFLAAGAGRITLTLIYHRTFEPKVPPLKTYTVEIVVA